MLEDVNSSADSTTRHETENTHYRAYDGNPDDWDDHGYNTLDKGHERANDSGRRGRPTLRGQHEDHEDNPYNHTHEGGNHAADGSEESSIREQAKWQCHQPATEAAEKQDSDDGTGRVVFLSGDTAHHEG